MAYLFCLGIAALVGSSSALTIQPGAQKPAETFRVFLRGFTEELFNPKALLYFICYSFYGYLGWKSQQIGMSPRVVRMVNKSAGVLLISVATLMVILVRS